ncbi:hypothetical protein [Paracoccus ravus]|uniref:hypothetical protein n=1 Tax=Paracoccus ravus TaxID=2447760 RepID=UPI00106E432A|nr:hypothetical protein [Paracoccus ravus]
MSAVTIVDFIEAQREAHGVEAICAVLPIAPSTYYDHLAKRAAPARLSARDRRYAALRPEIRRAFEENSSGGKASRQSLRQRQQGRLQHEPQSGLGIVNDVARSTVAKRMKDMGIQGIIRGKSHRTTIPDKKPPCPLDKVNREIRVDLRVSAIALKRVP